MRVRRVILILLLVLCASGGWYYWSHGGRATALAALKKITAPKHVLAKPSFTVTRSASGVSHVLPAALCPTNNSKTVATATNKFPWRLTNTHKSMTELQGDRHAILLENALIDTRAKLDFSIPKSLQSKGAPGAYIVQAAGPIDGAFRAQLAAAGAEIVSYIPNNAYLVQLSSSDAGALTSQSGIQVVIPFEPYYKVQSSLMPWLDKSLPAIATLNVGVIPGSEQQAISQIENAGGKILSQDGDILHVVPPANWEALAQLPVVHIVEPSYKRAPANDLTRVTVGVSIDTTNRLNYLNLYGSNVVVAVNDTGIDTNHPDFGKDGFAGSPDSVPPTRVLLDSASSGMDTDGHGTHVAGIIAGNGSESYTVPNVPRGSVTNADFRGKAPLAQLYSVAALSGDVNDTSDRYLQEIAAVTNALIVNNSWRYTGDDTYDLSAASWDASVRDALPGVTGSQPILPVFAAGNEGGGDDDGGGGSADTVASPATAKNVISVGAIEQLRNITNSVTNRDMTVSQPWLPETDSGFQVAGYSSRGNTGIGTEGAFGRFKPDVVAPGTFVVSTRSSEWDEMAYYDPTNYDDNAYTEQIVDTNTLNFYPLSIPDNCVGVLITITPNINSPSPFPTNLPIWVSQNGFPDPTDSTTYDFVTSNNTVNIPTPDGGQAYLAQIQNGGIIFAVGDSTNFSVDYDLTTEIITTNDLGNYYSVLSNLNNSISGNPDSTVPPHYYRYETGTSMSAPAVSGVLALMQDFFTNTLHTMPSPALLKAMLINGSRVVGNYKFAVTNSVNYQGWGLVHLPDSLPFTMSTNTGAVVTNTSIYFTDQSPSNSLATGDSHTYLVAVTNASAAQLPLRVTLVWTDPPGDPAAAIKLVNNLDLVVTNLSNGAVYFGNNFANAGNPPFSLAWNTNFPPNPDTINNVENIYLAPPLGTNYSVTVLGTGVNVNAVSQQTNNVVQDYALVISCGEGEVTNAISVMDTGIIVGNPTGGQLVTVITATNVPLVNQFVGANSPLLGTNQVSVTAGLTAFGTNAQVTIGQTNQWHFYIVTNSALDPTGQSLDVTNAAFVTYDSVTLSLPRMGVFAGSQADATKPEADIDLYVSTDPTLTNLNPVVISNCINGTQIGASVGPLPVPVFNGASLSRGGTEFIVDTNSQHNQVYYVGVKSEDQSASEFGLLTVFSATPFSVPDGNGNLIVHGIGLPVNVPDGSPAHPGVTNVFALAISSMIADQIIVTNQIWHQNFGDLIGVLKHDDITDVLNNHDALHNTIGNPPLVYNDVQNGGGYSYQSGTGFGSVGGTPNAIPSDGPGSLRDFVGKDAIGPWQLTEVDDSLTQTGSVAGFDLLVMPHQNPLSAITVELQPQSWFYEYLDVPVGYTNLSVEVFDLTTPTPVAPNFLELAVKMGVPPTLADSNDIVLVSNVFFGIDLAATNSVGPPLTPGRYYIGIYNPDFVVHTFRVQAFLGFDQSAIETVTYVSAGPVPLLDDAVTYSSIPVTDIPNPTLIQSLNVGLRVDHPRISDLVFHLLAPDGSRYLLMQNRGGDSTNGCGVTVITTNIVNVTANGTAQPNTNYINVGENTGSFPITYNFYTAKDQMQVFYGVSTDPANLVYDTGVTNNPSLGPGAQNTQPVTITVNFPPPGVAPNSTYLTIVMDGLLSANRSDAWTYTAGGVLTNYYYLTFTEDTNLTTTPIKFAPTPFTPSVAIVTNPVEDFESATPGDYPAGNPVDAVFNVDANQVSVVSDTNNAQGGSNFLALANGTISATLPTIQGDRYALTFFYRGPGIVGWWQGENNANDTIYGNNGTAYNVTYTNGVVNQAFSFDPENMPGTYVGIKIPDQPLYQLTNALTMEGWIRPRGPGYVIFWRGDERSGLDPFSLSLEANNDLIFGLIDTNNNEVSIDTLLNTNSDGTFMTNWTHVAATWDGSSGNMDLYVNGLLVNQTNTSIVPIGYLSGSCPGVGIGNLADCDNNFGYWGDIDEMSLYTRALSASEISAIAQAEFFTGFPGKYDPAYYADFSPAGSLAEASVRIAGVAAPTVINGNNTNWQNETIIFTAAGNGTPVQITGIEPGMLLDSFSLTSLPSDLYYLPEQDMTPLVDQNAFGTWQMEVQDDRAGATNNNSLVSWKLDFTFANTNIATAAFGVLAGGIGQTNSLFAGQLGYYVVNVPTNASYATNLLLFASLPVNVWFSTNFPPSITNSGDVDLIPNSTIGTNTLSTNNSPAFPGPPNIVPGTTYYLVVQNTNSSPVSFGVEVDFDVGNSPINNRGLLEFTSVKASASGVKLQWNAANGFQYQVQWTDSLSSQTGWQTIADPRMTVINGIATFTDNGTQTAPLGPTRFYRLVQISGGGGSVGR